MQTYHFKEVVASDGTITLSGLPPLTEVAVVVINPELATWRERMAALMDQLQAEHPFGQMSREEVLAQLRHSRQEVYEQLHGH